MSKLRKAGDSRLQPTGNKIFDKYHREYSSRNMPMITGYKFKPVVQFQNLHEEGDHCEKGVHGGRGNFCSCCRMQFP